MSALAIATDGYLAGAPLHVATDGYLGLAVLYTYPRPRPTAAPGVPYLGPSSGPRPGLDLEDLARVMAAQIGIALDDGEDAERVAVSIGLVLDDGEKS